MHLYNHAAAGLELAVIQHVMAVTCTIIQLSRS